MPFGKDAPESEGGGASVFLKFEKGKKQRVHIVSKEPLMFKSFYDKVNKKFIRVADERNIPGIKLSYKFAIVVLVEAVEDGVSKIVAKIFEFGRQIKSQLNDTYDVYDSDFSKCDFVIGKTGEGLKTEWTAVACPAKGMKFDGKLPELTEYVKMSSEEDIATYTSVPQDEKGEGAPF